MGYVKAYEEGDAERLVPVLREADRQEAFAASGCTPLVAILKGVEWSSFPLTIMDDQEHVAGIFGVVPFHSGAGVIWMLGSDALTHAPLSWQFIRRSREWCDQLNKQFPILFNIVDERNTVHIRWLKWCGFVFLNRHPEFGHEKRPFLEFARIQSSHV